MVITTPCPQCGGDIEFLEEARAIKCLYCGSLLHVVGTDGVRQYYLKPRADKKTIATTLIRGLYQKKQLKPRSVHARLFFFPYWWVQGMVFKWILGKKSIRSTQSGITDGWEHVKTLKTHRFDHSFPANGKTTLGPSSLGIRTGTMRFRAFNRKEIERMGIPIQGSISYEHAVDYVEHYRGSALKEAGVDVEMEKIGLIGERYNLIHLPIWLLFIGTSAGDFEVLVDGISHDVIKTTKPGDDPLTSTLGEDLQEADSADIRFIPLRCPICGWDLPFHPFNVIHLCTTCGRAWREEGGAYREVSYRAVKENKDDNKATIYLPFWTFQVSLITPREQVSTLDAFYSYFPVPRLVGEEKKKRKITFYVPAFKIKNIPAVNKFSALFTHTQPECDYAEKEILLDREVGDVYLTEKEAKEMAEIMLVALVPQNSRKAKNFVAHARLDFVREHLEWFPFSEKGIYLREHNTGFAIQKGSVDIHCHLLT
ncbi:MAG: hypothetical protein JW836_08025 [Deltaproteobacteria bacterium]|nr:hypothetical protein [Deltaproteobacteria bacterium]